MKPIVFTPPELAAYWHCKPATIIGHIKAGRLRAFTTSPPGCSRPRWRIPAAAIDEFEAARQFQVAEKPSRRRVKSSGRQWF